MRISDSWLSLMISPMIFLCISTTPTPSCLSHRYPPPPPPLPPSTIDLSPPGKIGQVAGRRDRGLAVFELVEIVVGSDE